MNLFNWWRQRQSFEQNEILLDKQIQEDHAKLQQEQSNNHAKLGIENEAISYFFRWKQAQLLVDAGNLQLLREGRLSKEGSHHNFTTHIRRTAIHFPRHKETAKYLTSEERHECFMNKFNELKLKHYTLIPELEAILN